MFDPSTAAAIVLKTSLLVVGIGLIALLMARRSAAWRHFLWTCALVLSLLMPIAVVNLPSGVQVSLPWETVEPWPRVDPTLSCSRCAPRRHWAGCFRPATGRSFSRHARDTSGMADGDGRLARRRIGRAAAQRPGACGIDSLGAQVTTPSFAGVGCDAATGGNRSWIPEAGARAGIRSHDQSLHVRVPAARRAAPRRGRRLARGAAPLHPAARARPRPSPRLPDDAGCEPRRRDALV